ncbi:hypothetical protein V6667_03020 [Neisseria leonii]|uniref:Uncharacterized protein n=1 Tax=Neisseria leonii TaxID=2995413 RepID=A0A9X4ICZ7_9NEIS|nr:hypothetical protein [Neisseria sp. 51.81]MDD9327176.1 hypothetical protein [Neisseria sp. 51.81]
MNRHLPHWAAVLLIPAATIAYFLLFPVGRGSTGYLIRGIILACEAAFLFKLVLFTAIGHHLRGEQAQKRQSLWLLLPLIALSGYTVAYFR